MYYRAIQTIRASTCYDATGNGVGGGAGGKTDRGEGKKNIYSLIQEQIDSTI